ncbi:MAG: acyltransferase [Arcobacter sp.]|uniref:acyltransferase n=1 Tax=uncultured Arcobacter sp. TaxID=165434 RepID=UPI000CADBFE6|nr:acyltransferase [uncultured Arcobacter sp.]PLY10474.1 MAG: acyltransferase [Arcobacter sp.]
MYRRIKLIYLSLIEIGTIFRLIKETKDSQNPIKFSIWFLQRILGFNRFVYWPVHFTSVIANYKNIYAGIDTSPGYSPGCYIQGLGKIYIGDYTQIAANVGIISSNHSLTNTKEHNISEVNIGKYCWIGMNAVILPNVVLGDFTVVGAGSVVSKSFDEGYCVIAGNPAKIIKKLKKEECKTFKNKNEYNGYIEHNKFNEYKAEFLNV